MKVDFIDTTLRDGSQSLWALRMTTGMMASVAGDLDAAGFKAIEVPSNPIYFKKFVRDHREDPWAMLRLMAEKMPRTTKGCMIAATIFPFELRAPREVVKLFMQRAAGTGALQRAQLMSNTMNQRERDFPWFVPFLKGLGVKTAIAVCYQISPRHTDDYYARLTREVAAFEPDAIYLKDAGGLLTIDRVRTLIPAIQANAGGIAVELHSHCTTGLAPHFYLEAARLGVGTLHTAIPPLADGSGQPSLFATARNIRTLGGTAEIDDASLRGASAHLAAIARREGLPIGAPLEFDQGQFMHQVPGGVISNLRQQLHELRIADRLPEVLDEVIDVQRELGYPMMITPYSQFVVTQAAFNVALGERYKVITDEIIRFALGAFGTDSGYTHMDQALRDRIGALPRATEIGRALAALDGPTPTLAEVRAATGNASDDDETFLLKYIMKGDQDIAAMRAAGPYRRFERDAGGSVLGLLDALLKERRVASISVRRGDDQVTLRQ
ncbi:MAG: hypothetical protein H6934_12645 [Burkholderiaceae bacterium]|nr:hypothetical protein [Burkholderiaceae bacterium]